MAEAPKSSSQEKSGEKFIEDPKDMNLAEAPGAEGDIDIKVNSEMGYNLHEEKDLSKEDPEMADAPKSSSQDKSGEKFIEDTKDMNLAEAPGAEGDIDIKVNSEMGYNLDESDEVKKN
jgi:hypothetical protein